MQCLGYTFNEECRIINHIRRRLWENIFHCRDTFSSLSISSPVRIDYLFRWMITRVVFLYAKTNDRNQNDQVSVIRRGFTQ